MKGGKSKAAAPKKAEAKLSVKKRGVEKPIAKPAKKTKAGKDPNMPKRPASAFFVFMEEFRETFKKKNPNEKRVAVVGKAGGEKWKSLSDADKAPFVARASKLKAEYDKKMISYNKKEKEPLVPSKKVEDEEESDKSKSEVSDNEDDDGSEEEGDDEDDD